MRSPRISRSGNAFLRYFEDRGGRFYRLDTLSDEAKEGSQPPMALS